MTYRIAYKKARNWQRKIHLVAVYHAVRAAKKKKWLIRDTARYFDIALSTAAENLAIAERWDKLRECKSRNEALKRMRGIR